MNNRFVRTSGLATAGVFAAMPLFAQASAPAPKAQPNILILYADDMGYGDLGANNPGSKIPTPNLDRLAGSGCRFTDGHSSSGICTPSRYALLTGRHHWRDFHGIVGAFGKPVFREGQLTLLSDRKPIDYTYQDGMVNVRIPNERASELVDVVKVDLGKTKSQTASAKVTENFVPYFDEKTDNPLANRLGKPLAEGGFRREGFHVWDPSIIKVGDTYHMFASCWPDDDFKKWKQSYVIRATSKDLLGPYAYVEDVLHPRPGDFFDSEGCHNPKITYHDGKYYLYHLGIPAWQSGVAVSDSVEGPWQRQKEACIPANNPALWIHDDGSVYGVGKAKVMNPQHPGSREFNHLLHYIQAFKADNIMGPYQKIHKPKDNALPENYQNEDPCIWHDGERYHMLLTDLHGHATGLNKAITYYTSRDGLKYELVSKTPLLARALPVKFADGSEFKFSRIERPDIVLDAHGNVIAVLVSAKPAEGGAVILVLPVGM